MNGKVALITGINGMDAKTLTHILLSRNYKVILTYRRNTVLDTNNILCLFDADLKNYPESSVDTVFMDITDQSSVDGAIINVLQKYGKIDELFHLAAQSHVGESFKSEVSSITTNGMSSFYILEALRKHSIKTHFYFANTSECFGGDPNNCPFNENSPQELRSPYSLGKNLGANITRYFRETYGMYACFGWLFNHSNIYRGDIFLFMRVIKSAARISLGMEKELKLGFLGFYRDEHLSDFGCEMMIKILNNPKGPIDYVVGNGNANYGEDYLYHSFNYFNLDWKKYVKVDESRFRPNEVVKLVADPRKAIEDLGWKPNRINLKQHIDLVAKYVFDKESGKIPVRPDVFSLYP
jgi:GDPmannose 4,6-dehydratase